MTTVAFLRRPHENSREFRNSVRYNGLRELISYFVETFGINYDKFAKTVCNLRMSVHNMIPTYLSIYKLEAARVIDKCKSRKA